MPDETKLRGITEAEMVSREKAYAEELQRGGMRLVPVEWMETAHAEIRRQRSELDERDAQAELATLRSQLAAAQQQLIERNNELITRNGELLAANQRIAELEREREAMYVVATSESRLRAKLAEIYRFMCDVDAQIPGYQPPLAAKLFKSCLSSVDVLDKTLRDNREALKDITAIDAAREEKKGNPK